MDVGEGAINYTGKTCPDNASTCLIGARDGVVTSSEVFEYALNDYEKYRGIIEGTLHSPIPWVLDDLDPMTAFDERIRIRVQSAIDQLKGILKNQGIEEGTEEHKEKMAVGLYYLAILPDTETIQRLLSSPEYATLPTPLKKALLMNELTDLGLVEFGDYLKTNGGFRVEGDNSEEYTALKALKEKQGECTEQSKILFALLRMAGLKPQFVFVKRTGLTSNDPDMETYLKSLPVGMGHVCIGLEVRGRFRLLDPAFLSSDPAYTEYFPLSLRQYLSLDYSNRGVAWNKKEEHDRAIVDCTRAIEIDSQNAVAYFNRGAAWVNKGELDRAIADFTSAIEIDSQFAEAYYNRGVVWAKKEEPDKAIADFTSAIKIDPLYAEAYYNRGVVWANKGEYDKAIADFTRVIEIDPLYAEAYGNLGSLFIRTGELEKAIFPLAQCLKFAPGQANTLFSVHLISASGDRWNQTTDSKKIAETFKTETEGGDISKVEAIFILSYSLWEAEDHEQAIVWLNITSNLKVSEKPSKSTKDFLENMFALMPESMKKDEKAQGIITTIKGKMD